MLDIQLLRSNLDAVAEGLAKRGKPIDFSGLCLLGAGKCPFFITKKRCLQQTVRYGRAVDSDKRPGSS